MALPESDEVDAAPLRMRTARGRWVIAAAVLGSGVAFLDGTVVNVALTAIADDFSASLSGLQWVLTGYLLTLGSFLVIGGSLGDLFGRRRVFLIGLVGFAGASLLCGLAPSTGTLIGARCLQGFAAALLVPGSLAIISASFHRDDRGRAIGAWSGPRRHLDGHRPVPRRLAHRLGVVAIGVPHQPADHRRHDPDHAAPRSRVARRHGRPPGRLRRLPPARRPAWVASCTRSSRDRPRIGRPAAVGARRVRCAGAGGLRPGRGAVVASDGPARRCSARGSSRARTP